MKSITVTNGVGNVLTIGNELQTGVSSYISRDVGISNFIYVENPGDFPLGWYLVGTLGTENAEIVRVTAVTLPTTSIPGSVTVAGSAVTNRHNRGDIIQHIMFDRIEVSSSPTETGTYTVLAGSPSTIQVSSGSGYIVDAAGTPTTFYKIRYNNSTTGAFSDYSTPFSSGSSADGTAGALIAQAKASVGASDDSLLTSDFMLKALNDARDIVHRIYGYGKAKDYLHQFEFPIKLLAGTNYVALPTDIDFNATNRSLFSARFSSLLTPNGYPLSYIDKSDWNMSNYNLVVAKTAVSALAGATTLVLDNSGDFSNAGAIVIQSEDYNGAMIVTSYTANDRVTNTLTLSSGLTRNVSAGMQVSMSANNAYPTFYTVFGKNIVFNRILPQVFNGKNLMVDYYKKHTPLTQLSDTLPEPYYSVYEHYLRYAIKKRRDDSLGEDDPDLKMFLKGLESIFGNDYLGQTIRIR